MTSRLSRRVRVPLSLKKIVVVWSFVCAVRGVFSGAGAGMFGCGVVFLALSLDVAADAEPSVGRRVSMPLALDDAVAQALSSNTSLQQRRQRAQAATFQVMPAGAPPDPRVSINVANLPVDDPGFGDDPMTQVQIGLAQDVPFPGKLKLRREAAAFDAQSEAIGVEALQSQVVHDVKQYWWQLFYLDRALETLASTHELMRQMVATAQSQYVVGRGLQQDVLQAQLELSKLLEEEIDLAERRRLNEAALAGLLDWPLSSAIELPPVVETTLTPLPEYTLLMAMAMESRAELQQLQARIDAAESRRDLAQRERYPDFRLAAVYGQRQNRSDLASLQFSMSLPLYAKRKQRQLVDHRDAELIAARAELRDLRVRVATQVTQALARYDRARDEMALYEDGIIPQAKQTVDSMLAGYQVNKVNFMQLVRAQAVWHTSQKQFWLAFAKANQALAQMELAVGRELTLGVVAE